SAYVPMSAVLIGEKVWRTIRDARPAAGPFSHGYTYSGHPLGAAAALATLDIVVNERLAERAERVGSYLLAGLRDALDQHEFVGEVRGVGMLAAIEFVADRERKTRFDPALKVGGS